MLYAHYGPWKGVATGAGAGAGAGTGPGVPIPNIMPLIGRESNPRVDMQRPGRPRATTANSLIDCRGPGGRLLRLGCTAHAYRGITGALAAGCPSVESGGDPMCHSNCPQRPKTAAEDGSEDAWDLEVDFFGSAALRTPTGASRAR